MGVVELFFVALGLAMDAFAVSIGKGLSAKKWKTSYALLCGVYFGGFQALMPLAGYFLGSRFAHYITAIDHWIAFALLAVIGLTMIKESREEKGQDANFHFKAMLPLAVATSIDALAVGVGFAFLDVNIVQAVLLIGLITCFLSFAGVGIGNVFGIRYKARAEIAGGVILILMGTKILLEHLNILRL